MTPTGPSCRSGSPARSTWPRRSPGPAAVVARQRGAHGPGVGAGGAARGPAARRDPRRATSPLGPATASALAEGPGELVATLDNIFARRGQPPGLKRLEATLDQSLDEAASNLGKAAAAVPPEPGAGRCRPGLARRSGSLSWRPSTRPCACAWRWSGCASPSASALLEKTAQHHGRVRHQGRARPGRHRPPAAWRKPRGK